MRKLKFHEQKLLKKVNFLEWKREGGHRETQVMHRYHITGRDDYKKYFPLSSIFFYFYRFLCVYRFHFYFVSFDVLGIRAYAGASRSWLAC